MADIGECGTRVGSEDDCRQDKNLDAMCTVVELKLFHCVLHTRDGQVEFMGVETRDIS